MYILIFGCGQKENQELPMTSDVPKNKNTVPSERTQNSPPQDQRTEKNIEEKKEQQVQLVYFHNDFIVSGTEPKYVFVPVEYVSEQKILDDLYEQGKKEQHFYTCLSTGATFLGVDGKKAKVQLQGQCGECGAFGIYDHITETLKQLDHISTVQVLAPDQKSSSTDRPSCLEP